MRLLRYLRIGLQSIPLMYFSFANPEVTALPADSFTLNQTIYAEPVITALRYNEAILPAHGKVCW
jgi:hypothetical protein